MKLTDAERHERFKEMAREVGASDDPKAFDKAFKKVAEPKPKKGEKGRVSRQPRLVVRRRRGSGCLILLSTRPARSTEAG
jgi:hypothetical protein